MDLASKITLDRGDWFNTIQQSISGMRGFEAISLENFLSANPPIIKTGSLVEVDGAIFEWTQNEPVYNYGLTLNLNDLYIKLVPSIGSVKAYFTEEVPTYISEKNGLYLPNTSQRFLSYGFKYIEAGEDFTIWDQPPNTVNEKSITALTSWNGDLISSERADQLNGETGAHIQIHDGGSPVIKSHFQHPTFSGVSEMFVHNGDLWVFDRTSHTNDITIHSGLTSTIKEYKTSPNFGPWTIVDNRPATRDGTDLVIYTDTSLSTEYFREDIGHGAWDMDFDGTNMVYLDDSQIKVHEKTTSTIKFTIPVNNIPTKLTIADTYYTVEDLEFTRYTPSSYQSFYIPSIRFMNTRVYSSGKVEVT